MFQTQQPVLKKFYYPVMPASMLAEGPRSVTMFGEPVVLWLDEAGRPSAAVDRCCHRTAKLSKGTVNRGSIVCPYHGWQFDGTGKCTYFPQSELENPPKVYKIKAYHCEERYGHVWVALDDPIADIPAFKRAGEPGFRQIEEFYHPIGCSALRLMENSFDNAHIAFVHHNTFGENTDPVPAEMNIVPFDGGFDMYAEIRVTNKLNNVVKVIDTEETETVRRTHSRWFMPFIRQTDITYPTGLVHSIVTCATPIDDESCMLTQFVFRNDTEADVPAEKVIAFDKAVVDEDMAVLESTEANVPLDLKLRMETHMHSDKPGILMREMLLDLLERYGEREVLPQFGTPQVYKIELKK
ncbi:aromatic ring-hydroxylating dioxygenase subunit alpha [Paenibacillus rhizovicinus]|uniref:Aromatic ring-hydroxylating dioxygenase subunit alpha n=1 Tax=Paenibacillus rhizovicinus TaxID=2704463 RepID=A0A6C0NTG2_9BACL|nr:aromatic ring-hydroxylating dioxygenase subunit alpha [Paenibacillus rhizovicinus]QHW29455.1 aromatic ring-hydroxylating dioxygenase subunit alpha [Paenibacillus rhizovicinus]